MKKPNRLLAVAAVSVTVFLAIVSGCKYDVVDPLWDQPYTVRATPVISQIQPSSAPAGVNTILITGQNLNGVPDTNGVYFGTTPAQIVTKSATSITVRRPALVTDSCTVKIVSDSAVVVARARFGKIDLVMERVGNFKDNIALGAVALDSLGNLFVASGVTPVGIWKVTPAGDKTSLAISGLALRPPFDGKLRSGVLYLLGNNREIQQVNLATGVSSRWTQMPSGRVVKFGDFDANGYFYTGGVTGSDLCIVPPNPPSTLTLAQIGLAGSYAAEEILAVKVSGGYLYVASRTSATSPAIIWRHAVSAGGQLAAREQVLDLSAHSGFSTLLVRAIAFSASGQMCLTTDAPDPLLIWTPASTSLDYFYKGIVPPYGKHSIWGSSTLLYVISGDVNNADSGLRWNVARVDMGTAGAPSP
jgi:hypothetical protein